MRRLLGIALLTLAASTVTFASVGGVYNGGVVAAVPEIDTGTAVGAVAFLFSALAILRARRSR